MTLTAGRSGTARAVVRANLAQSRRSRLGWVAGVAGLAALYTSSFRSIGAAKGAAVNDYPASLRHALNLHDLTAPAGYLASTVFGLPLVILVTIYAVSAATALAADEESGRLALQLALPVTRADVVIARIATIVIGVLVQAVVLFAVVVSLLGPAHVRIGIGEVASAVLAWLLLGCCLGAASTLVGAATGRHGLAVAASSALALVWYLADSFLPLLPGLSWVRAVSPYGWYADGKPLERGIDLMHCGLLAVVTVVLAAVAVRAFGRRDLRG
jgi:ABC-2 type transport system permease protein